MVTLTKTMKAVMETIEQTGMVSVNRTHPFAASRRTMLNTMEEMGLIHLCEPVIGSYLVYNKVEK